MIVEFTDAAEVDLEQIGDRIADDNPVRAATFIYELRERCRSLATFPDRFPSVRDYDGRALRKLSVHGYLIFYTVNADTVEIIRIVHGARDWATIFDEAE